MIPLSYFLVLSALMFSGGLFGILTQKNAVRILVSVEIMLNAANVAIASFAGVFGMTASGIEGWSFMIIIIAVAAAEAAIGMAIFLTVFRNHNEIVVSDIFSLGETEEAL